MILSPHHQGAKSALASLVLYIFLQSRQSNASLITTCGVSLHWLLAVNGASIVHIRVYQRSCKCMWTYGLHPTVGGQNSRSLGQHQGSPAHAAGSPRPMKKAPLVYTHGPIIYLSSTNSACSLLHYTTTYLCFFFKKKSALDRLFVIYVL